MRYQLRFETQRGCWRRSVTLGDRPQACVKLKLSTLNVLTAQVRNPVGLLVSARYIIIRAHPLSSLPEPGIHRDTNTQNKCQWRNVIRQPRGSRNVGYPSELHLVCHIFMHLYLWIQMNYDSRLLIWSHRNRRTSTHMHRGTPEHKKSHRYILTSVNTHTFYPFISFLTEAQWVSQTNSMNKVVDDKIWVDNCVEPEIAKTGKKQAEVKNY